MKRSQQGLFALALACGLALVFAQGGSAHEGRTVGDGKYELVVGFLTEPAYTGEMNGIDLQVFDLSQASPAAGDAGEAGAPVEGLEDTLKVEIIYGDQKMDLPIEGRWKTPGAYDGWVIPTAAGDYTFHITGTIGGTAIDESFTSSPDGFGSVADRTTIEFPKAAASSGAPVFGTVTGGGGSGSGVIALSATALAVAVAGSWFFMRRRVRMQRPVVARMSGCD